MNRKTISVIAVIIAVISIFAVFFALKKNEGENGLPVTGKTEDPFKETGSAYKLYGNKNAVGGGIKTPDSFVYDGKPLELEYFFDAEKPCVMGLMIFVDGMLQPYIVEDEEKETTMHTVELGEKDEKSFKVRFTPLTGEKGDELEIYTVNVYNALVLELKGDINTFGNWQKATQANPRIIKFNKSVPKSDVAISKNYFSVPMSAEEIKSYTRTESDGTTSSKLFDCETEIRKGGEILCGKAMLDSESLSDTKIYVYGKVPGRYRVSLYGDFNKLKINGADYVEVEVKKDEYAVIKLTEADSEVLNYKNIFAVSAPVDCSSSVSKSSSLYITDKNGDS